jgi:hypothetical protein
MTFRGELILWILVTALILGATGCSVKRAPGFPIGGGWYVTDLHIESM